jgi:phytoene dehydrogenase-like protein
LPRGTVRCSAQVSELLIENQQVHGVRLANGEKIEAEQVVIATSSLIAQKLLKKPLPTQAVSTVCLYFAGDERLYAERKILLNTEPDAYINNAVLLTNIAPTYAPPRKHLLSVTIAGIPEGDDELIVERCRAELAQWFPEHNLARWQLLGLYRIPFAQFAQPAGIFDELPANSTDIEGLSIAGEYTKSSSIQGAMHSGEHAAKALLKADVPIHA